MLKYLGILIVGILTSIYYFPIFTTLLPSGLNTKMVIALLGLVIGGWKTLQAKSANIDKTFFVLTIYAIIVSLVCCFSIVYNGTVDTAYASYFISMLVWLSGAYALCNVIKVVHGQSSIVLLTNYLTANRFPSRCIFSFFSSIEGWTYRFMVIFTLACPNISLKLLISKPTSTHLVANVCLNA